MRKILLSLFVILILQHSYSQEANTTLSKAIDDLTFQWDNEAINLNNYAGLTQFCVDKEYRYRIIDLLNEIHHFDSVLYKRLVKASRTEKNNEIDKTLKEIAKFEDNYSMKKFIHFLHEECKYRSDIEKNAKVSKDNIGENSYDGQIYLVETELNQFIKQITKRMDHIRKHVHHLNID